MLRRRKTIGKLHPKADGSYRVIAVGGQYGQRVTIELLEGGPWYRPLTIHASQVVPYLQPYVEPEVIDLGELEG